MTGLRPSLAGGAEGLRMLSGGRRSDAVLDELAAQACEIDEVGSSVVFVRHPTIAELGLAAAGRGVPAGTIGSPFDIHEGAVGVALAGGRAVVVDGRASAPIAWGGAVKAALSVDCIDAADTLGDRSLEALVQLVDLAGAALEQAEMRDGLEVMVRTSVELLAGAVDARDRHTAEHSDSVVELATGTARRMGLPEGAIVELEFAARLHDVGKIAIPDSILHKPGPLNSSDWEIMRTHPEGGARMLRSVPELVIVAEIVRSAHERWDGRGYPDGLAGDGIPLASRVIFACDAYDAMMSDRPYRSALGHHAAVRELRAGAGSQFDPRVVEALVAEVKTRTAAPLEQRVKQTA